MPSQTSTRVIMRTTQGVKLRHAPAVGVLCAVHRDGTDKDPLHASKQPTVVFEPQRKAQYY